jgi:hypothetical protein
MRPEGVGGGVRNPPSSEESERWAGSSEGIVAERKEERIF